MEQKYSMIENSKEWRQLSIKNNVLTNINIGHMLDVKTLSKKLIEKFGEIFVKSSATKKTTSFCFCNTRQNVLIKNWYENWKVNKK